MISRNHLMYMWIETKLQPNSGCELRAVERLLLENQDTFLKAWNEYFGT